MKNYQQYSKRQIKCMFMLLNFGAISISFTNGDRIITEGNGYFELVLYGKGSVGLFDNTVVGLACLLDERTRIIYEKKISRQKFT